MVNEKSTETIIRKLNKNIMHNKNIKQVVLQISIDKEMYAKSTKKNVMLTSINILSCKNLLNLLVV